GASLPRIDHLGLPGCDSELAHRLDVLARGLEFDGVVIRAGTRVDVAGDHLFLGSLAGGLVDEGDVEVLLLEVAERVGELVWEVDLLVQTADHDLERNRLTGWGTA